MSTDTIHEQLQDEWLSEAISILTDCGVTEHQFKEIGTPADECDSSALQLIHNCLNQGFITSRQAQSAIGRLLHIEVTNNIDCEKVDGKFLERIPIRFARQHCIVGLTVDNNHTKLVVGDLATASIAEHVAAVLQTTATIELATREDLLQAIDKSYSQVDSDLDGVVTESQADDATVIDEVAAMESRDLLDNTSRAPTIKLVNMLLFEAAKRRVSDVHIQPLDTHTAIRYRIDGVLYDFIQIPRMLLDEVVSRIKVIGKMDIAEKRLSQDGRTTVTIGQKNVDLRISIIPTSLGERVVIRLLDKSARLYLLPELGMGTDDLKRFQRLITQTHGIILVTGPTGSGKSTTLYAALQYLDCKEKNILTLEDPIEYQLPGISQTQVSSKKGMTFATGLRTVLRQDPDVIMVGEIRDEETARMAIQSSLTGHLVFSTLHTNDAPSAVARLLDLGIEPYLIASSLLGVLAQRLIRVLCQECAETTVLTESDRELYGIADRHTGQEIQKRTGCSVCAETGYRDRKGIFELLVVNEAIRYCIAERSQSSKIREAATDSGMTTLRQDGIRKAILGLTDLEEVARVTCQAKSAIEHTIN